MGKLPEGRRPLTWKDMEFADKPRGHPSTWEAEAKALRAENERLRRAMRAAQQFCDAGAYHTAAVVLSDALAEPPRNPEPLCGVVSDD